MVFYNDLAGWLAIAIAVGLLIDAILLPRMVARYRATEPVRADDPPVDDNRIDLSGKPSWYRPIAHLSRLSGEFVAYWCVIAVFVYYYEVLARYVFNSPTNWAHESMFLMFGMQYLICGAHAYLTDSHVRVDVFYARFSRRKKALADIATSFFFFVFAGTLLITGWIFAMDADAPDVGPVRKLGGQLHRMGDPVLAGQAGHGSGRAVAGPAGSGETGRGYRDRGPARCEGGLIHGPRYPD